MKLQSLGGRAWMNRFEKATRRLGAALPPPRGSLELPAISHSREREKLRFCCRVLRAVTICERDSRANARRVNIKRMSGETDELEVRVSRSPLGKWILPTFPRPRKLHVCLCRGEETRITASTVKTANGFVPRWLHPQPHPSPGVLHFSTIARARAHACFLTPAKPPYSSSTYYICIVT